MALASYTQAQIISDVRLMIQERLASRFESADLIRWSNEAVLEVCHKTGCLKAEATASGVSGQAEYMIPLNCADATMILRLDWDGKPLNMVPLERAHEMLEASRSLSSQGTPEYWAPFGRSFILIPVPKAAGTLRAWYIKIPEAFSGTADTLANLGISEAFGPAIEYITARRAFLLAGDLQKAEVMQAWADRLLGFAKVASEG